MWEEKGTDEIDGEGHETWDKSWTTNNEVSLWYLNNDRKPGVTNILNDMMCANPASKPTPTPTKGWTKHSGDNCWGGHGATDMENPPRSSLAALTLSLSARLNALLCLGVLVSLFKILVVSTIATAKRTLTSALVTTELTSPPTLTPLLLSSSCSDP
jgi:hypothetical protein